MAVAGPELRAGRRSGKFELRRQRLRQQSWGDEALPGVQLQQRAAGGGVGEQRRARPFSSSRGSALHPEQCVLPSPAFSRAYNMGSLRRLSLPPSFVAA